MTNLQSYYQNKNYGISKSREKNILQLIENISNKDILDVGCSTGYIGKKLLAKGNGVYGLDISEPAIREAKKVLTDAWCLDIEHDVIPRGKYDLIIASEIIEHVFDPEVFLTKLKNKLVKNGQILISTPNFLHMYNRKNFLLGKMTYDESGMFDRGHIRFFNYNSIRDIFAKTGLKILSENHVFVPNIKIIPSLLAYQFVFLLC